jgi:phosphoribosyl-ATP pyrophosphohydrolase
VVNDGLTLPLEVRSPGGDLLGVVLMNAKAANKSRERGELWTAVPPGDRVLPIDGCSFTKLEVVDGHRYRAVLADAASEQAFRLALKTRFAQWSETDLPPAAAGHGSDPTLTKLREVIAQRRRELPEGSYTTLLFQKGEDKIRKKTGEEAIELILATTRKDIVFEAADLIYHMMVLLEVKGIPVADVLAELESRMK